MQAGIAEKLAHLPDAPGVYLMKNSQGDIFYIGKAKSLRDRMRNYLSGTDTRAFVTLLEHLLADIEVILTNSEKEALLLENELIKTHKPRFNVKLTDDKRFLCLRLNTKQRYPRLEIVRRFGDDGASYFGPYHSAKAIREALRIINRYFQLRTCTDQVMRNRQRPCLQYQIKRCPAPCVFDVSDEIYTQNVNSVVAFLSGRQSELVGALSRRMHEKADAMEFEAAAVLRNQLQAVKLSLERQSLFTVDFINRDVVGIYREGPVIEIHVMRTRKGSLIDARRFSFTDTEVPTSDVLADFASRYYTSRGDDIPEEILFPEMMEWGESLSQVLSDLLGQSVKVFQPKRGDKYSMVLLACKNAQQAFADKQREAGTARTAIERLQHVLNLKVLPRKLECFDISHLQGSHIVASVVHLADGIPQKELYRHYKIRSTQSQDDFKSMYEVVGRRVQRGLQENNLPDLLVIDGGKGQLNAAKAALDDHGAQHIAVIGLAKSRLLSDEARETGEFKSADLISEAPRSAERVFVLGQKDPVILRQNSAELFMLTRARDEAHRFAITFHRRLRQKAAQHSALDQIAGIGPKRRQALLKTFGSISRLRAATQEDIAQVVGQKAASQIKQALKSKITSST